MECSKCNCENAEGVNFCNDCGHNFSSTLSSTNKNRFYDKQIDKIQRFFPQGLGEKILSQKGKIEGERRQITVMFCDMEGFTPLVEKLGPEKAYLLMDEIYEILIHKVHDFEGTVNEMTGDGVMALFGAPVALEDAPSRALRSALSIHEKISNLDNKIELSVPIKMRIGIHTGPVIVGALGNDLRVEFKAVGDTVNLAYRMEGLAEAGSTYITNETYQLTKNLFQFEELGGKNIKGKKEPVIVYKLVSAKKDVFRPRVGFERMIYSKMVGRDNELDKIELQVMKAINGEGSVINIIGEAGIGKSRLITELKNRELMKKVVVLEGRAISIGRNLSFYPISNLLRHWAKIKEDDSDKISTTKLEKAIRKVCFQESNEILPFIATLMGIKLSDRYAEGIKNIDGEGLQKIILKSLKQFLIKATELDPLVIIMEDLHWADTTSIELLESLFHMSKNMRIVFINVFRPGYNNTGDRVIEMLAESPSIYSISITVLPLNEQYSNTLIDNMLKIQGLQQTIKGKIISRADGNPFFIEEVVRSFIDQGVLIKKNGAFKVSEDIDSVVIPDTINDVLMTRIDRLEEETRNLLKMASVIGRNFFYRILSDVANSIEDIDEKLFQLKIIQLIREQKRMDEIEYMFKHALAQEAAYESILVKKRKELHLKVAESIESVFKNRLHEFYGMLALHYSKGENEEKTEEYLIKAGEEALRSSASSEALHYYKEALNLYVKKYGNKAEADKILMLKKNIALAYYNKGSYLEATEYFEDSLSFFGVKYSDNALSELRNIVPSFIKLLIFLYLPRLRRSITPTIQEKEALDMQLKNGQSLLMTDSGKRFVFNTFNLIGKLATLDLTAYKNGVFFFAACSCLFYFTGLSFALAKKMLTISKPMLDENDARSMIIFDTNATAYGLFSGDYSLINDYENSLIEKNLKTGEFYCVIHLPYLNGFLCLENGDFAAVKSRTDLIFDIADTYDSDYAKVIHHELKSKFFLKQRKVYEALPLIEEGIVLGKKIGLEMGADYIYQLYSYKTIINLLIGDIEAAQDSIKMIEEIHFEKKFIPFRIVNYLISKLYLSAYLIKNAKENNNKAEYHNVCNSSFSLCKTADQTTLNCKIDRVETLRLIGLCHWVAGKQKKAIKYWEMAINQGERINALLELSRTYFEIGKCLLKPESKYKSLNKITAEEYLDKAKIMFEKMDLQWDLEQLERLTMEKQFT